MIAFVRGSVFKINSDSIFLDHDGLGFRIFMNTRDLMAISPKEEVFVYTYMQVKEDGMALFGFLKEEELSLFKLLINVSGVGPKIALSCLSSYTVSDINFAILSDDDKTLSKVSGLGAKTAKKIILELKDKIDVQETISVSDDSLDDGNSDSKNDAISALCALGYSASDALRALSTIENAKDLEAEELIKLALKNLALGL
ncbi:MAG: Holliday junction branch migration protein RuvA [Lachnospiraceae bacterium]|nr:Holliday junction branch migration protein RuvA [Lachnospiraceae bacterium]